MKRVSTLEGFQTCSPSEEQQADYYGSEGDARGGGRRGDTRGLQRGTTEATGTGPRAQLPDRGVTAAQALAAWAPSEGTAAQSVGKCSRHIAPVFSHGSTSPDTHLSARISPL